MKSNEAEAIKKSYVDILEFASTASFVTYQGVFDFIHQNNITFYPGERITESSALLQTFFKTFFVDDQGKKPSDLQRGAYHLSQEALFYLLNHEGLEFAKQNSIAASKEAKLALKQAKLANLVAILGLSITALLAVLQIYLQLTH